MKEKLKVIKSILLHILFPSRCSLCGAFVERDILLCEKCVELLPLIKNDKVLQADGDISAFLAPFFYEMGVDNAIRDFKFHDNFECAKILSIYMTQTLLNYTTEYEDYILIPAPLYPSDERVRGYNQAAVLCDMIAEKIHIDVDHTSLKKTKKTKKQHESNGQQRKQNLISAFSCSGKVSGKQIILVDDICTTGSTAKECAKMLKAAGASRIILLTAARVRTVSGKHQQ